MFYIDSENNFFSPKLILYLQPYIEKSERARTAANLRWNKVKELENSDSNDANAYANAKQMECVGNANQNASKVKESKVKESKVKETKTKETKIHDSCSGGCDPDFNIYLFMQQCGFVSISPVMMEKIDADIEVYSLEELKAAVEIADNAGKHSYAYVKGVLEKRRAGGGWNHGHGSDNQGNESSSAAEYDFSKYTG